MARQSVGIKLLTEIEQEQTEITEVRAGFFSVSSVISCSISFGSGRRPANCLPAKWIAERIFLALARTGRRDAGFAGTTLQQATCGYSRARNRRPVSTFRSAVFFHEFRHKSFLENRFGPVDNCALEFLRCAPAAHQSALSAR